MSGRSHYVHIQVDESFVNKTIQRLEARLNEQEDMILGLQELLSTKIGQSELQTAREGLRREMDE
jgi:hypothetical protein